MGTEKILRSKGSRFRGFRVYFHEKGQFWLSKLPNIKKFSILPKKVFQFSFHTLKEKAREDKDLCANQRNFSFTKCIEDFVSSKVGCSLNWFQNSTGIKCKNTRDISETQSLYQKIRHSPYDYISRYLTKCFQKCNPTVYDMEKISEEDITWKTEWLSEVKYYNKKILIN